MPAAAVVLAALGVPVPNALNDESRNLKKISTPYPTRNATASGETARSWAGLNRPATAPAIRAVIRRAESAEGGWKVRLRAVSLNCRNR